MGIADDYIRFTLRLPERVKDRLLARARHNQRSVNSEIVAILEAVDQTPDSTSERADQTLLRSLKSLPKKERDAIVVLIDTLARK